MSRASELVVDSDGHVMEPMTMWQEYIEPRFRNRAPVPEDMAFGMTIDGVAINTWDQREPNRAPEERQRRREGILSSFERMYPEAFAAGFDAQSRLRDLDREGIDIAVLYPSFGLFAIASDEIEPALADAVARAYNNWLIDYCSADAKRLRPIAMLALHDPAAAAQEVERMAAAGAVGAFVRPNPVLGRSLGDPAYDRIWAAMQTSGMALGIHEGGCPRLPQVGVERFTSLEARHVVSHPFEQMLACLSLVYEGALERFPTLNVVFLESGCGWAPFWLDRMDDHFERNRNGAFGGHSVLQMPPSEYFKRQCFISTDPAEELLGSVGEFLGEQCVVFSTDYPHPDSLFPHTLETFLGLESIDDSFKRRVIDDNGRRLYRLDSR